MATNWKNLIETQSAKTYVLPQGWDSRSAIAEKLECSEDRVRVLLSSALKNGTVEVSTFPVWDEVTKRVVRVTAYRKVTQKPQQKK